MKRILLFLVPLVFVGGILALAFVTQSGGDARAAAEFEIRRRIQGNAAPEALSARIDDYLSQYDQTPDAHWFACDAYLRIGKPRAAAKTVWSLPAMRGDPETPPHFARLYLLRARADPSAARPRGELRALAALADAGVEEARKAMLDYVRRDPDGGWTVEASLMLERAASPFLDTFREAVRQRGTPVTSLAAALTEADAAHPEELARLEAVVGTEGKALPTPLLFAVAIALGTSRDPEALRILDAKWRAAGRNAADPSSLPWLAGLAAAGDAELLETLGKTAGDWGAGPLATYFIEAIARRVVAGDPNGARAALTAWGGLTPPAMRWLLATRVCMPGRDAAPLAEFDPLLKTIESADDPALRAAAAARRFRLGEMQAERPLMRLFMTLPDEQEPQAGSPYSEALLISATALTGLRNMGPR